MREKIWASGECHGPSYVRREHMDAVVARLAAGLSIRPQLAQLTVIPYECAYCGRESQEVKCPYCGAPKVEGDYFR